VLGSPAETAFTLGGMLTYARSAHESVNT